MCSANASSRKSPVAGPSVVNGCVHAQRPQDRTMQAACVGQRTVWTTVRLPARAACGPALRIQSSHSVSKSSGRALSSRRANWPAAPGFEWRGSREAGVSAGVCALCSRAAMEKQRRRQRRSETHGSSVRTRCDDGSRGNVQRAAQVPR